MHPTSIRTTHGPARQPTCSAEDLVVVSELVRGVARRWFVSVEDIMGSSHRPEHAGPRHDLWSSLWGSGWSYSRISRAVGRDVQTVRNGVIKDLRRMREAA